MASPVTKESAAQSAGELTPRQASTILVACNLLMFLKSICVMVMELTASRLIAKSVGSSLYTWTSVIGVVLAGISLGNFLGGWLADRYSPRKILTWQFLICSFCVLTIYPLNQLVASSERVEWISWPMWIVLVVTSVFFHPSVALGTISPVVASWALSVQKEGRGKTVGSVFAWETMGSIAGTFLAGFFLISQFGTQNIIWMVAGLLCLLGLLVGTGQKFLRGAMLFGWLQFVLWIGFFASATQAYEPTGKDPWLQDLFGQAHEIGRKLNLRGDDLHEYTTESDYFYINVANVNEDGDTIKALHLDHLTHSYYNPFKPTKLYYEYELVYAGVTERAMESRARTTSVALAELPVPDKSLPPWARFDAAAKTLGIEGGLSPDRRMELLRLSPEADYWKAVEELTSTENQQLYSGMSSASLPYMPDGVIIPEHLREKIRYDDTLKALVRYAELNDEERTVLLQTGPNSKYRQAIEDLYGRSRQVSTLFIGGGGFVFPRWVEAYFPHDPRIDVLELDPAVKLAVQKEMGLPPDNETRVHTMLGDARNSVDDLLRANSRRTSKGQTPELYDFAYGDAFNDFSVPWHLTTKEFCQKVSDLLNDEGVYLVNIIDIYPRAVFPIQKGAGKGQVRIVGKLPKDLTKVQNTGGKWERVEDTKLFGTLEFRTDSARKDEFELRYTGEMDADHWEALTNLFEEEESDLEHLLGEEGVYAPRAGIDALFDQTHKKPVYVGKLPSELLPESTTDGVWINSRGPFPHLEVFRKQAPDGTALKAGEFSGVLGYRGIMPDTEYQALLKLAPDNKEYQSAIKALYHDSQKHEAGRFMGSYIRTLTEVFPNVYVFSTQNGLPSSQRDTFVAACSKRKLKLADLRTAGGHWETDAFAWRERKAEGEWTVGGQMPAVLSLSRGITLTDDYAPVDNMLAPVFEDR